MKNRILFLSVLVAFALAAAACGSDASPTAATDESTDEAAGPVVAVTTNILGDVVTALVGDQTEVIVVMPVGADPHDFQPSAQEVDELLSADIVISNGGDFEEGLLDVLDSVESESIPLIHALDFVETIEFGESSHDDHDDHGDDEEHDDEDHDDEEHSDEEHSDEDHEDEDHDEHDHSGEDPHFFTDPARMAEAVEGISGALAEVDGIDVAALEAATDAYLSELAAVDAEVSDLIGGIPEEQRVLVTNHDVFGYLADRFEFEVVGVVIQSASTSDAVSAGDLAALAEEIEEEGVPAIFADFSAPASLAETLAAEVGSDVAVVELFSESLGDADSEGGTYLDMVRTNAERIADALS